MLNSTVQKPWGYDFLWDFMFVNKLYWMSGRFMESLFVWRITLTRFLVGPHIHFIEIHKFVKYLQMKPMNIHVEINCIFPTQISYFAGSDSKPVHYLYYSQFRKMCPVISVVKTKLSLCQPCSDMDGWRHDSTHA